MNNEFLTTIRRASVSCPHSFLKPVHGLEVERLFKTAKFKYDMYHNDPNYFKPSGTLVFCGSQGEGKTLSGVDYIQNVLNEYPNCILVTNTRIRNRPVNAYIFHKSYTTKELEQMYSEVEEERRKDFYNSIIEELTEDFYNIKAPETTLEDYLLVNLASYPFNRTEDFEDFKQSQEYQLRDILTDEVITTADIISGKFKKVTIKYTGLDCLKYVNNAKCGVIFFIDEIHLELNSQHSKIIDMDVITEISQQRKQRKHIVGTSQRVMRMAKPLREQIPYLVICKNFFGSIQYNCLIDGESLVEGSDGTFKYEVKKRTLWFHSPEMYKAYDTYAKMQRYNNEWQERPQLLFDYINELYKQGDVQYA